MKRVKNSIITKYRPQTLSAVVGQAKAVAEVTRLISTAEVYNENYLITGPWGSGKTTLARIMAKTILCEGKEPQDLNPCCKCPACKEVDAGGAMRGYIELDAGASGGIEEIRNVVEQAAQHPGNASGWKVFVIDECHRLTGAAASAMLKVLEEKMPVVFIMVTTDPQKLIATIKSRLKSIELGQPTPDQIRTLLEHVCNEEGLKFPSDDDRARILIRIAERSAPHVRDCLMGIVALKDKFVGGSGVVDVKRAFEYFKEESATWFEVIRAIGQGTTDPTFYDTVLTNLETDQEVDAEGLIVGFTKILAMKGMGKKAVTEGLTLDECRGLFWIMWKALKTIATFKTFAHEVMVFAMVEAAQAKNEGYLGGMSQFSSEMLAMTMRSQSTLDAMEKVGDTVRTQRDRITSQSPKPKSGTDLTGFKSGDYE